MATVFPPAEDTKNVVLGNVNDGPNPSSTKPTEKNANPNAGVAGGEANALMTTKPVHHDAFPSQEKAVSLAGKGNPLVACPSVGIAEAIKVSSKPYDSERNRFRHDECPELEEESVEDTYSILIQTLFIVCCIIAAKICMRRFIPWKGETDLSEISLVFTGLFFIMGQMFSNVNADLKEAEKMPMDLVSSLDQMEDGFVLCSAKIPEKVNLLDAQFLIAEFARTWRDTLLKENNKSFGDCLNLLADIVDLTREWDKKGAANTVNILNTVDKVRRTVARATVIKRTDVLPSARALLNFFIFMSCSLLFLASYKTEVGLSVVMACVMTVCIFMGRIIHSMDDPFNIKPKSRVMKWVKGHMASIQLFPVLEYIQRMERRMERQLEGMRVLQMQQAGIMQPALKPT